MQYLIIKGNYLRRTLRAGMDKNKNGKVNMTRRVFGLLAVLFLLGTAVPATPAALSDPYAIFRSHYQAIGGIKRLLALKSSYSEGTVAYDGLSGTFRQWEKRPILSRLEEDFSTIRQVSGDDGDHAWLKDTNGRVFVYRDRETQIRRDLARRMERFEHLDPSSPVFTLVYAGKTRLRNRLHYMVRMQNRLNSDVGLYFFDAATFLLSRMEVTMPDVTAITDAKDFRTIQGLVIPFDETTRIQPRGKMTHTRTTLYRIDVETTPHLFRIPKSIKDFRLAKNAVPVPFAHSGGNLFLPVSVDGEKADWMLDSGASMTIVDNTFAARHGKILAGSIRGFGFGSTFALGFARLPGFQVGGLTINPQTVFAFPGLSGRFARPVAGILGYDFFSRPVSRIDIKNKTITFYDPDTFSYNGPGVVLDAPLKYRTFSVPATLDNVHYGHWSLDLGADDTSLFFPFAEKYGYLERPGATRQSRGLAGSFQEKKIKATTLAIGPYVLHNPTLSVPLESGSGSSAIGEMIGNMGLATLSHFVVWLDYNRQQVIFEKQKEEQQKGR